MSFRSFIFPFPIIIFIKTHGEFHTSSRITFTAETMSNRNNKGQQQQGIGGRPQTAPRSDQQQQHQQERKRRIQGGDESVPSPKRGPMVAPNNSINKPQQHAPAGGEAGKDACRAFAAGTCRRGAECRYAHVEGQQQQQQQQWQEQQPRQDVCRNFQAGNCRKGAQCRFVHDGQQQQQQQSQQPPPNVQQRLKPQSMIPAPVNWAGTDSMDVAGEEKQGGMAGMGGGRKNTRTQAQPQGQMQGSSGPQGGMSSSSSSASASESQKAFMTGDKFENLKISEESRRAIKEVMKVEYGHIFFTNAYSKVVTVRIHRGVKTHA